MFPLENIMGSLNTGGLIDIYDQGGEHLLLASSPRMIPYDLRKLPVISIEEKGEDIKIILQT